MNDMGFYFVFMIIQSLHALIKRRVQLPIAALAQVAQGNYTHPAEPALNSVIIYGSGSG